MLVLIRRPGQSIRVGDDVWIKVTKIEGDRVHIGVAAPDEVGIDRGENVDRGDDESDD